MITAKKAVLGVSIGVLGVLITVWSGLWLWLILSTNPISLPISNYPLWPAACTTRGCVTFATWSQQYERHSSFANLTNEPLPEISESFTTIVRRHLVSHAVLQTAVTDADAKRYRENILHLTDTNAIQESIGISATEYDQAVVLPFLEQEALIAQNSVESAQELYQQLAGERFLILLSRQFKWDKNIGEVVPNN